MDLEFTSDQEALRDGVRELLARECPSGLVRELAEKGTPPTRLWSAQVDTGWPALAVPEDAGGLGLGAVEIALVAEEAGRCLAPGPWLPTATQYAAFVAAAATPEQQTRLLAPVAAGEVTGAAAIAETASGTPPATYQTVATRDGDGWRLTGTKHVVVGADSADRIAVVASVDEPSAHRLGVFVVDATAVDVTPVPTVDRTRPWGKVVLDGTRVPPEDALGEPGTSADAVARALDLATMAVAAEIVGVCAGMHEHTLEYVTQRQQFGVAIGSFQAIKHKLADDLLVIERARAAVYFAALTIAEDDDRRPLAVAMAKAAAGDAERRVVEDSLQTHGGIGYTWEHDLQLSLKRAKANGALLGSASWHRARVADFIGLPQVAS